MKKLVKILSALLCVAVLLTACSVCIFAAEPADAATAAEQTENNDSTVTATPDDKAENTAEAKEADTTSAKAVAAAVLIAIASGIGAVAMALSVCKSVDSTARQPEAAGGIRTTMMMGLVFIETAIIYALIVAILIIFVL